MSTATLTSKGQLVIPKDIRDYMRLQPGDRLDFIIQDDGEVVIRPVVTDVRELKGVLKIPGRTPVSVSTMKQTVRKRAGRADFSDYLIGRLGTHAGCQETVTFDKALRASPHFRLL